MSKFIEIQKDTLINLDNIKTVKGLTAKNGGQPMLLIAYMDCTGSPLVFNDLDSMKTAYRKILNSNDKK